MEQVGENSITWTNLGALALNFCFKGVNLGKQFMGYQLYDIGEALMGPENCN